MLVFHNVSQGTSMSRKKWSQPLMWGMIIAILNPLGVLYALIGVVIGNTLTFVWCAMLAWAIYFYAIYLPARPHDSRLVQIYLLLMGTLMLPWGLVLLITCS
jgi:zinc transporter ZupT